MKTDRKNNGAHFTRRERSRYWFDNAMSRGTVSLVLLLFLITFLVVVLAGILAAVFEGGGLGPLGGASG